MVWYGMVLCGVGYGIGWCGGVVYGMVYGICCMVYGVWYEFMVYGIWYMEWYVM